MPEQPFLPEKHYTVMQSFSIVEIKCRDRFYRANFINSLQGFKPVSLIGMVNETGQVNLAIFSNIVHIGADPALFVYPCL